MVDIYRNDSPVDILLVEPNPDDANHFREAFEKTSVETDIHVVTNREKALEFIHRHGEHTDAPLPDLILLERHLPNEGSEDILTTLKGDPKLREQPVLVLVSEDGKNGARLAYDLNANASIQKPVTSEEFDSVADSIARFWFMTARLPPKRR